MNTSLSYLVSTIDIDTEFPQPPPPTGFTRADLAFGCARGTAVATFDYCRDEGHIYEGGRHNLVDLARTLNSRYRSGGQQIRK